MKSEFQKLGLLDLPSGQRRTLYLNNLASHSRMPESIAQLELQGMELAPEFKPVIADVHTCAGDRCGLQVLHVGVGSEHDAHFNRHCLRHEGSSPLS